MHILRQLEIFVVQGDTVPYTGGHVIVRQLVEDAVAAQDNEVVIFIYFE